MRRATFPRTVVAMFRVAVAGSSFQQLSSRWIRNPGGQTQGLNFQLPGLREKPPLEEPRTTLCASHIVLFKIAPKIRLRFLQNRNPEDLVLANQSAPLATRVEWQITCPPRVNRVSSHYSHSFDSYGVVERSNSEPSFFLLTAAPRKVKGER